MPNATDRAARRRLERLIVAAACSTGAADAPPNAWSGVDKVRKLKAALAEARAELACRDRQIAELHAALEAEREAFVSSQSWRVTAPLRWLSRRAGRG